MSYKRISYRKKKNTQKSICSKKSRKRSGGQTTAEFIQEVTNLIGKKPDIEDNVKLSIKRFIKNILKIRDDASSGAQVPLDNSSLTALPRMTAIADGQRFTRLTKTPNTTTPSSQQGNTSSAQTAREQLAGIWKQRNQDLKPITTPPPSQPALNTLAKIWNRRQPHN